MFNVVKVFTDPGLYSKIPSKPSNLQNFLKSTYLLIELDIREQLLGLGASMSSNGSNVKVNSVLSTTVTAKEVPVVLLV